MKNVILILALSFSVSAIGQNLTIKELINIQSNNFETITEYLYAKYWKLFEVSSNKEQAMYSFNYKNNGVIQAILTYGLFKENGNTSLFLILYDKYKSSDYHDSIIDSKAEHSKSHKEGNSYTKEYEYQNFTFGFVEEKSNPITYTVYILYNQ